MRPLFFAVGLALTACSTAQVTTTCQEAQGIIAVAQPFLGVAPIEVRLAVTALGTGAVICGSAEYAKARDVVVAWLQSRRR